MVDYKQRRTFRNLHISASSRSLLSWCVVCLGRWLKSDCGRQTAIINVSYNSVCRSNMPRLSNHFVCLSALAMYFPLWLSLSLWNTATLTFLHPQKANVCFLHFCPRIYSAPGIALRRSAQIAEIFLFTTYHSSRKRDRLVYIFSVELQPFQ